MHQAIKAYLDGKFFLAPLDNPQTILDIGYAIYCSTHGVPEYNISTDY